MVFLLNQFNLARRQDKRWLQLSQESKWTASSADVFFSVCLLPKSVYLCNDWWKTSSSYPKMGEPVKVFMQLALTVCPRLCAALYRLRPTAAKKDVCIMEKSSALIQRPERSFQEFVSYFYPDCWANRLWNASRVNARCPHVWQNIDQIKTWKGQKVRSSGTGTYATELIVSRERDRAIARDSSRVKSTLYSLSFTQLWEISQRKSSDLQVWLIEVIISTTLD